MNEAAARALPLEQPIETGSPAAQIDAPAVPVSLGERRWRLAPVDDALALTISQRFDVPEIVARIMTGRDIGLEEAGSFLAPRLRDVLPDPSHLLDMDKAVGRLVQAIEDGEPIGIIADYDVDGATSCAILTRFVRALGADVHVDIPDRLEEGYGPNDKAFARLEGQGCQLVVILDAGTTAFEPLEAAAANGHEVIVVDHHAAEERLPEALALINPNRLDQESPLGDLAAVGVTFMLCIALHRAVRQRDGIPAGNVDLMQWLDLVALGTVCDLVPLTGVNRALVAQGVKVAAKRGNPGLAALSDAAKLDETPNAGQFGFVLGPRINAGGRTGQSSLGAELLTSDDPDKVATLAGQMDALNQERRRIEKKVLEAAEHQLQPTLDDAPVLVAAGENWSPGVVGVVASRLVERYHRPAVVIGLDGETGKGSGRSIQGFDLGAAIIAARQDGILEKGGGHPMAAGLTVAAAAVERLRSFLTERLHAECGDGLPPPPDLLLDVALDVSALTLSLGEALDRLGPFGRANREPRLLIEDAMLHQPRRIGDNHLDCWLADPSGARVRAVAFRIADRPLGETLLAGNGRKFHLAGRLKIDSWQGRRRASFQIEDATPANAAKPY